VWELGVSERLPLVLGKQQCLPVDAIRAVGVTPAGKTVGPQFPWCFVFVNVACSAGVCFRFVKQRMS